MNEISLENELENLRRFFSCVSYRVDFFRCMCGLLEQYKQSLLFLEKIFSSINSKNYYKTLEEVPNVKFLIWQLTLCFGRLSVVCLCVNWTTNQTKQNRASFGCSMWSSYGRIAIVQVLTFSVYAIFLHAYTSSTSLVQVCGLPNFVIFLLIFFGRVCQIVMSDCLF